MAYELTNAPNSVPEELNPTVIKVLISQLANPDKEISCNAANALAFWANNEEINSLLDNPAIIKNLTTAIQKKSKLIDKIAEAAGRQNKFEILKTIRMAALPEK